MMIKDIIYCQNETGKGILTCLWPCGLYTKLILDFTIMGYFELIIYQEVIARLYLRQTMYQNREFDSDVK